MGDSLGEASFSQSSAQRRSALVVLADRGEKIHHPRGVILEIVRRF